MRAVNFDDSLYRNYVTGRSLSDAQRAAWAAAFTRHLPPQRPLRGLDFGSGTGRFTPLLAERFGGPVTGVEPAGRMRDQAVAGAAHPRVTYVAGRAEELPLPYAAVDFALGFLVWHHVRDRPAAARELHRVVRPGGTLLLRTPFTDHLPDMWWLHAFPRGPQVHAAMYRPLAEVRADFETAGWEYVTLDVFPEPPPGTRAAVLARLRGGSSSLLEHFTAADREAGFAELERRVAADPEGMPPAAQTQLLVLRRERTS